MPFGVLCASCEYSPTGTANEGSVTCELVHQRVFARHEEAEAYARDIWLSPSIWGHPRRSPQDVIRVIEVAAGDAANLDQALHGVTEDAQLQGQPKHVYEVWIGGKNPYEVTLAEAHAYSGSDAMAVLEGDDGGQTYIVCPVKLLHCDEATLKRLLADIDAMEWPGQPELARLSFHRPLSDWWETERVWVHERLQQKGLESRIRAVLAVERATTG